MTTKHPIILDHHGAPIRRAEDRRASRIQAERAKRIIRAKFDAAQTTDENSRHWANADYLGPNAELDCNVRRKLRSRARYECSNNTYAHGMILTLANDTVGTGPSLQLVGVDKADSEQVEAAFWDWAVEIKLPEKLRVMRIGKARDGESFGHIVGNPRLPNPVKIDLWLYEAEQISADSYGLRDSLNDGVIFDDFGNVAGYQVLQEHPGDLGTSFGSSQTIPASEMIHYYNSDRAGQVRGCPEITAALPLYALLRRYTLAVIRSAESAALLSWIIETQGDPQVDPEPFDTVDTERGMGMTLPRGSKMSQLKAEQPTGTYSEFKRSIICEIARCLGMPFNVAAGDSSGYNYSSGRLDHKTYFKAIRVERSVVETIILDRLFAAWFTEARYIPGLIPDSLVDLKEPPAHEWRWDGDEHIDPTKDAAAVRERVSIGLTSIQSECSQYGSDLATVQQQNADALGLSLDEYRMRLANTLLGPAAAAAPRPVDDESEDDEDNDMQDATAAHIALRASGQPDAFRFSAPVDLEAKPAEGKRPTFSIVAYTGVPMNAMGFYSPVIVELSGVKASREQIPILLDHDPTKIVGMGAATVDSSAVRIAGSVMGEDADAQKVTTLAKNGFQWQASIGATVTRREFVEAGKKAIVNGREVAGPIIIARESILNEVSFVAIGADQQTSAAVAATHRKDADMNFSAWLQAKGIDEAKLDDATKATLKASYDAEQKPGASGNSAPIQAGQNGYEALDGIFQSNKRERARRDDIAKIAAEALREHPSFGDEIEAAARKAVDDQTEPREFELIILRACRNMPVGSRNGRRAQHKVSDRVIEAAVCMSAKLEDVDNAYDEQTLEAAHKVFRGGLGLQQLLLMAARENGCDSLDVRGGLEDVLRAALPPKELRAAGNFSTISLPNILSNVANKFVTEAFMSVEQTWREITAIRPVSDFKQITNHSLTGDLQYEELGPSGEIRHGIVGEEVYYNQAKTYGKQLAITRRDIINDDLGAFAAVPRRLGRGGALKINDVFWTAFMDNSTFFTTGRANYDEGTDTALTAAGLAAALTMWDALTDPDGKPMGTTAKVLLVPPGQWFAAQELMTSSRVNTGGSASTARVPDRNVFEGMFKVVKSRYLANSSYTGYSALAWYLLCDPSDIAVIETCFLGGKEMPTVETADADFDQLGIRMRAFHDFGVTKQEYRGGMKFKGET